MKHEEYIQFLREFRQLADKWSKISIRLDGEFTDNGLLVPDGIGGSTSMDQDLVDRYFIRRCKFRPAPSYEVCALQTEDGEKFCQAHRKPCCVCGGDPASGCSVCHEPLCSTIQGDGKMS